MRPGYACLDMHTWIAYLDSIPDRYAYLTYMGPAGLVGITLP